VTSEGTESATILIYTKHKNNFRKTGEAVLQGGSVKGTGAGCPHVLQYELAGKTTGLAKQGVLAVRGPNKCL